MENKLGLCYYKMLDVEKKIVNFKLNLLDETFTFNCNLFSIDYLIKLNKFLFEDIYNCENNVILKNEIELDHLKLLFSNLENAVKNEDINEILDLISEIWHYQLFIDGNTRTMIAYLKIIAQSYLLDILINVNDDIESNPKTFKRLLTKKG